MYLKRILFICLMFVSLLCPSGPAFAVSEEEQAFLAMYFKPEELVVISTTRSLKSIARVAENVEVVTAEDIELMNAHTVADVLNTVNGVQSQFNGSTPGNSANVLIQSSETRHVSVFLDGIPLNNLSNNVTTISSLPVQMIKKIEIIKGPASSAWGSSLGGIINIITESAPDSNKIQGTLSASYGEQNTGDFRAEVSGRKEKFGFYLSAGRLQSDGFRPANDVSNNNVYAKMSLEPTSKTRLLFSTLYGKEEFGNWQDITYDTFSESRNEHLHSNLMFSSSLSNEASMEVSLWYSRWNYRVNDYLISDGSDIFKGVNKETRQGANAKFFWNRDIHNVVVGAEYEEDSLKSSIIFDGEKDAKKWALYANDTISFGRFSITPGLRYDETDINGEFISPSLGLTYELPRKTLLRAYIARGFSIPPMSYTYLENVGGWQGNPDLKVEQVWSYQAGVESGAFKYFWLKLSAFRHDIKDGNVAQPAGDNWMYVNKSKIERQGFEAEIKTMPVYNTSLSAGTTHVWTKDRETDEELKDVPKHTYKLALQYDDKKSLRALLQGNYTWWNSSSWHLAHYSAFIFDANIIKTLYQNKNHKLDAFLSAHNIFNGSQYWDYWFQNAPRWIEAGVRYQF